MVGVLIRRGDQDTDPYKDETTGFVLAIVLSYWGCFYPYAV